jgi:hypothetical protein
VANAVVFYNESKTFVIEHPLHRDKYLVHACLEGPEAGVYYRGTATILASSSSNSVQIYLAEYVEALATEFTVYVMPVLTHTNMNMDKTGPHEFPCLIATPVRQGNFTVYSNITPCVFYYLVMGKRQTIEVEPRKKRVTVKGIKGSPYKWI